MDTVSKRALEAKPSVSPSEMQIETGNSAEGVECLATVKEEIRGVDVRDLRLLL